jgi:uncharacterized membrane protein YfcA
MLIWLAPLFAFVALIYASVGFGGGSTYTALLTQFGVEYTLVPLISLLCNIVVVTGGTIRFRRAGLYDWRQVLPLLLICAFGLYWRAGAAKAVDLLYHSRVQFAALLSSITDSRR